MNHKNIILAMLLVLACVAPSVYAMQKWSLPDHFCHYAITGEADKLEQFFIFYTRNDCEFDFDIDGEVELIMGYKKMGLSKVSNTMKFPLMHFACINGHVDVIKLLIKYGASINKKAHDPIKVPLQTACAYGQIEVVKFLLKQDNLEIDAHGENNETALLIATHGENYKIVELLLKAGASIKATTYHQGRTALHLACENGNFDIVTVLLEYGAVVNVTSNDGWTPLGLAELRGYQEIANLLRTHA